MLKVNDINVYYGAIHAIKNISFEVNDGEIVTLIGANGAGKTTTLQTISGLLHTRTGSIEFMGKNIVGVPPHKVVAHGLAQVPEGRRVFLQMTVEENLQMGAFTRPNSEIDPGIADPSMGLAPILVEQIFDIIRELNHAGVTILLVEQNARMALSIAHRGYVLETGKIVATGTGAELLEDEAVKKAYLGG